MLEIKKREIKTNGDFIHADKKVPCSYGGQKVNANVGQAYKNDKGTIMVPIEPAKGNKKTKPMNVSLKNLQFDSYRTKCRLEKQIRAKLNGNGNGKKQKAVA